MNPEAILVGMQEVKYLGNLLGRGSKLSVNLAKDGWNQIGPLRLKGSGILFGCPVGVLFEYLTIEGNA